MKLLLSGLLAASLLTSCKQVESMVASNNMGAHDCTFLRIRLKDAEQKLAVANQGVKNLQMSVLTDLKSGMVPSGQAAVESEKEAAQIHHEAVIAEEAFRQIKDLTDECLGNKTANVPVAKETISKPIASAGKVPTQNPKSGSSQGLVAGRDYVACDANGKPGYVYLSNGKKLCYPFKK